MKLAGLPVVIVRLLLVFVIGSTGVFPADGNADVPPWEPRQGSSDWFMPMHRNHLQQAAKGDWQIVFFGDSITQFWSRHPTVWNEMVGDHRAANFGIGGDRTQEMLWRISDGLFAKLTPRVIVFMAGANNWRDKPDDTAKGIAAVVSRLRQTCPESSIILLAMLPNGDVNPYRNHIATINREISSLADGDHVRYLDMGKNFVTTDGTITKDIMYDQLHLAEAGYRIWVREMKPLLDELMVTR